MTWGPTQSLGQHHPRHRRSRRRRPASCTCRTTWTRTATSSATCAARTTATPGRRRAIWSPDMGTFCFSCNPRQHPIVGSARGSDRASTSRSPGPAACPAAQADDDVWLLYSKDGGDTWTQPIRVNDNTNAVAPVRIVGRRRQLRPRPRRLDRLPRRRQERDLVRALRRSDQGLRAEHADHRRPRQRQHRLPRRLQGHRGLGPGRAGGLAGHAARQRRHLLLAGRRARQGRSGWLRTRAVPVPTPAVRDRVRRAGAAQGVACAPTRCRPRIRWRARSRPPQWREHLAAEEQRAQAAVRRRSG